MFIIFIFVIIKIVNLFCFIYFYGFGDSGGGDGGYSDDMVFDVNISDKIVFIKEVILDKRVKRKVFVNVRFFILLFFG